MGDVVRRDGKKGPRFYVRYVENGKRMQRAAPPGKRPESPTEREKAAHAFLAAIETNIRNGRAGLVEPTATEKVKRTVTVSDLIRRFLGEEEGVTGYTSPKRIKSIDNYRRDARSIFKVRIEPVIGKRAAALVTRADVEKLRDDLTTDGKAGASVVQTLATLSKLYNWSREAGHIDCVNPAAKVERPRSAESFDYLDNAEAGRLLAEVADLARSGIASANTLTLAPMTATAIYCGMRKGELFGLRWRDVHLDAARLDVNRSYNLAPKSGKPRHLRLHPALVAILRAWKKVCPETKDGLVFPVSPSVGVFRMGVKLDTLEIGHAFDLAGCHRPADGKPWHMLRHTFASHAVMSGVGIYTLQKLLGHATAKMTERYAHLAPDFLGMEIARMNFAAPSDAGVTSIDEARRKRATE